MEVTLNNDAVTGAGDLKFNRTDSSHYWLLNVDQQNQRYRDVYINGGLVATYTDSPPSGSIGVGLGVENYDTTTVTGSESVTATFTDFAIYSEPK